MPKLKYSLDLQCREARVRELKRRMKKRERFPGYTKAREIIRLVLEDLCQSENPAKD